MSSYLWPLLCVTYYRQSVVRAACACSEKKHCVSHGGFINGEDCSIAFYQIPVEKLINSSCSPELGLLCPQVWACPGWSCCRCSPRLAKGGAGAGAPSPLDGPVALPGTRRGRERAAACLQQLLLGVPAATRQSSAFNSLGKLLGFSMWSLTWEGEPPPKDCLWNVSATAKGIGSLHIPVILVYVLCFLGRFQPVQSPAEELHWTLPSHISVECIYTVQPLGKYCAWRNGVLCCSALWGITERKYMSSCSCTEEDINRAVENTISYFCGWICDCVVTQLQISVCK